jgi:hypothetical protein
MAPRPPTAWVAARFRRWRRRKRGRIGCADCIRPPQLGGRSRQSAPMGRGADAPQPPITVTCGTSHYGVHLLGSRILDVMRPIVTPRAPRPLRSPSHQGIEPWRSRRPWRQKALMPANDSWCSRKVNAIGTNSGMTGTMIGDVGNRKQDGQLRWGRTSEDRPWRYGPGRAICSPHNFSSSLPSHLRPPRAPYRAASLSRPTAFSRRHRHGL